MNPAPEPASTVLEPGFTWRTRMPRGVLGPRCPRGEPITTPTDRRMLWHLAGLISVTATNDVLRQAGADLRAYLGETCEHHWHEYEAEEWTHPDTGEVQGGIPTHRQCLWCSEAELLPDPVHGPAGRTAGSTTGQARAQALGRLAALAPWPSPDGPGTANAVAAWLAVDAQRHLHRNRPDPCRIPDPAGLGTAAAELIAVHVLITLRMLSHVPDAAARCLVEALADGAAAVELLAAHLDALGIDPDEVNALEDQIGAGQPPPQPARPLLPRTPS